MCSQIIGSFYSTQVKTTSCLFVCLFVVLLVCLFVSLISAIKMIWIINSIYGKYLIYHLLNKNFRKSVKDLLNKISVNQTIKLLPFQTPTSIPLRFRWYIIISVPEIKPDFGEDNTLREITFVKSESLRKYKTKLCTKLNKIFSYMDGINYRVLVSPPLLARSYNFLCSHP